MISLKNDPVVDRKLGGIDVFGRGLALYNSEGKLLGALGISVNSSCTDYIVARNLRHRLNLANVPEGVSQAGNDIIYDIRDDVSKEG